MEQPVVQGYVVSGGQPYPSNAVSSSEPPGSFQPQPGRLGELEAVLRRFDISIADANDLVALEGYRIMLIADDSGSMSAPSAPPGQRTLGEPSASRWQELREAVALIVDIGSFFDPSGVDVVFLNRPAVRSVRNSQQPDLLESFSRPPAGGTPLTETLSRIVAQYHDEAPVLLFILTDGEPNGGVSNFKRVIADIINKRSTSTKFRIQIMACTGDDDAVGWLNELDAQFKEVDVTDDYYSEMMEVLKKAKLVTKFSRADWCVKAMLGPVSQKFDSWDEKKTTKSASQDTKDASESGCCVIA